MSNILINDKWSKSFNKETKEELGVIVNIKGVNKSKVEKIRKPINLSLAIDVSGSMSSYVLSTNKEVKDNYIDKDLNDIQKMLNNQRDIFSNGYINTRLNYSNAKTKLDLVKEAAIKALSLLEKEDTVSIVTFSHTVKVLAKNLSIKHIEELKSIINNLRTEGSTDLFEGWRQAALCVAESMKDNGINRVLLLTDGETNQGVVDPDQIATNIKELSLKGISTSSFGVGDGYNEDLLQNIADAGDGNFYYMKDAEHFEQMFCDEFNSIMTVCGRNVSLKYTSTGFKDLELMNDFLKSGEQYTLPNLSSVNEIVLAFKGVAKNKNSSITLNLSYESLDGVKESVDYTLRVIPYIKDNDFINQDVIDRINELKVSKLRKDAINAFDKGDKETAMRSLSFVGATLASSSEASRTSLEMSVNNLSTSLKSGEDNLFRKQAVYDNYNTRNSKLR